MKKATSKFFFFQCRLLNYFVHGTIPRYSFFYCSFCLPLHFEISKQFFLLPIISFMKLSNNSFGLLRFSLQSLNLFSYDIGIVSYKNVSDLILIQDSFLRIVMFSFHLLKVKPNAITVLVDCTSILLKFFWVNRYVSGDPYLLSFIFY